MSDPKRDPVEERTFPALSGSAWKISGGARLDALPTTFSPGDFLVGEKDCAAAANERAARDLHLAGVGAIIAVSFAADFFARALAVGLPAAAIEEAAAIKSGDRLRVDIETFRIANLSSGDRYVIRNLPEEILEKLRQKRQG